MSLATRIVILVTALLGVCGVTAGVAFHRAVKRSLDAELQGRLDTRLAWLAAALDVELEDGELQLNAPDDPPGADAAPHWQIATTDGRVLWASAGAAPAEPLSRSETVSFGQPDAPSVSPAQVSAGDVTRDDAPARGGRAGWITVPPSDLPAASVDAARRAVPGFEPTRAYRKTRLKKRPAAGDATFELRGTAGGREYALRLDGGGNILRIKDSAIDPFAEYEVPTDAARLDLVLTAQASASEARDELSRLSRTLWAVGPFALAATAAGLALLIRWQLRPLARMADEAAHIGPATVDARIHPVGRGSELIRLRQAINQMVARLGEGMERERRFAADAAHELRTPLAEMRTTVEVALRRPRDAPEYREALEHVATDLLRLQNLVVGLLQLTRGQAGVVQGRPLPLRAVLNQATERAGGTVDLARGARTDAAPDGPWVLGDPELVTAAIVNVLQNAARYAPGSLPTVRVETNDSDATVQAIISDRGPGIAESDRERIFQPLTRLDDARSAAGPEGFGLGLAVARTTARAFGGDLVCRGRADGALGAEFVFTLRRAAPPDAEAI